MHKKVVYAQTSETGYLVGSSMHLEVNSLIFMTPTKKRTLKGERQTIRIFNIIILKQFSYNFYIPVNMN